MQFLPFAGLIGGLAAFLLSTRQFQLGVRLLIWILGSLLLSAAIWFTLSDPHAHGLVRTALSYPHVLIDAFEGNWQTIGAAFSPLLDVLGFASIVVALVCLIALTPGDLTEHIIRPFGIGLVGAILGAAMALAVTGIGFGGASKRQVYVGVIAAGDVHDGDTISMGDTSLRIWGIDAPELDQRCIEETPLTCGELARQRLASLLADQLIVCTKPNAASGAPRESFGRPLVTCLRQSDQRDVGHEMVRIGCAAAFRDKGKVKSIYLAEEEHATMLKDDKRACPRFEPPGSWRSQR